MSCSAQGGPTAAMYLTPCDDGSRSETLHRSIMCPWSLFCSFVPVDKTKNVSDYLGNLSFCNPKNKRSHFEYLNDICRYRFFQTFFFEF